MNQNSITTYREKVVPTIKKRHEKVMYALRKLGIANVYDIAETLNVPVHSISGRLTELSTEYDIPVIEKVGMTLNKYKNPCTAWKIREVSIPEQQQLF